MKVRALILVFLCVIMAAAPAPAQPASRADAALVLEVLGHLRQYYVDPIDVVAVLNAAVNGLRAALSNAGIQRDLQAIPSGTPPVEAEAQFRTRFEEAVAATAGRIPESSLAHAAAAAMTDSLNDSHTGFIPADRYRERLLRQQGQPGFSGVGIVLFRLEGRFYVRDVIPGGPAQTAGVQQFDRIVRVDNVPTAGLETTQISGLIRGPSGTPVTLVLERPGRADPVSVTITRAPIQVPAVFQSRVGEGGTGYLKFDQFSSRSSVEFREALNRLLADGMRALVLDLRANSGGLVAQLEAIAGMLLPPGRPVYQESRRGVSRTVRTTAVPLLPSHVPLVVLIDEGSASAAELLSSALRENERAVLVGAKTAGAVEAAITVDLSDGSGLLVTIRRLASAMGRRLEGVGVAPDIAVPLSVADLDQGRDSQLARAFQAARDRLGAAQREAPAAAD